MVSLPQAHTVTSGARTAYFWGGRKALPWRHLCPPTAVFLVPVRARQLNASCGKESPPGNYWSEPESGKERVPGGQSQLPPTCFPHGVSSSLLSPPPPLRHGFQKPSMAISAPCLSISAQPSRPLGKPWRLRHSGSMGGFRGPQRETFSASSSPVRAGHTTARSPGAMQGPWFSQGAQT